MTTNEYAPRCSDCDQLLQRPGAICHVCDVETHFEGALRTAPPMVTPRFVQGRQPQSDLQAS